MSETIITVEPMAHRKPGVTSPHIRTLATMLKILDMDKRGETFSRDRKKLINSLPVGLRAAKIDDWLKDEPGMPTYTPAELLLTDEIESTNLLQTEVYRTVVAGAEKMKVIRATGCPIYQCKSNALDIPLGEAQINAPKIAEGAEIRDRTQDYSKRSFSIEKYAMKPRISFEMIEDGLVDVAAQEIFWAGAAVENRLNLEAILSCVANKGNVNTYAAGRTSATAGNALPNILQTKSLMRADGYVADTIIMCSDMEYDLMQNANILQAERFGGSEVIRGGILPKFLGLNVFVTDNGVASAGAAWRYTTDNDTGAVMLEAGRGCGIAMKRDITVNRFDDFEKELKGITVTMRADPSYLVADAVGTVTYQSA